MKKVLLILLLNTSAWAACPLFTYPENHKLDAEINSICDNILNPTINYETVTKAVFKNISVPNGSASTDATAYGQLAYLSNITQVVSITNFSTTSNTYQNTNLTGSITPSSASSRIRITVSGVLQMDVTANISAQLTVLRGSTNLAVGGDAAFARIKNTSATDTVGNVGFTFIDSPATTSVVTYNVALRSSNGVSTAEFGQADDQVLTLQEVR